MHRCIIEYHPYRLCYYRRKKVKYQQVRRSSAKICVDLSGVFDQKLIPVLVLCIVRACLPKKAIFMNPSRPIEISPDFRGFHGSPKSFRSGSHVSTFPTNGPSFFAFRPLRTWKSETLPSEIPRNSTLCGSAIIFCCLFIDLYFNSTNFNFNFRSCPAFTRLCPGYCRGKSKDRGSPDA